MDYSYSGAGKIDAQIHVGNDRVVPLRDIALKDHSRDSCVELEARTNPVDIVGYSNGTNGFGNSKRSTRISCDISSLTNWSSRQWRVCGTKVNDLRAEISYTCSTSNRLIVDLNVWITCSVIRVYGRQQWKYKAGPCPINRNHRR